MRHFEIFKQWEFFLNLKCYRRLILIEQKLVENAKIEKSKCDILGDFQIQ